TFLACLSKHNTPKDLRGLNGTDGAQSCLLFRYSCISSKSSTMPAPEPRIFEDGISPQDEDNGQGERRIELEQQRRMQLTLQNLQCAMDPVIAAGVYNNNYSPLASLPKAM